MAEDGPAVIVFREGDYLSAGEGGEVVRASPASIVVVAGTVGSGKTTLVGGLYELFHRGPFGGFLFAGSRTLPGFERRCHLARVASGLEGPDTERTRHSEGMHLLHLRLAEERGLGHHSVLFSDIYGEAFRRAADSADECRKIGILKRADHAAVLVDGARAADLRERQAAFSDADSLLGQCLDAGMFDSQSSIQVVVTKWDLVAGDGGHEKFVDGKIAWLTGRYSAKVGSLTTHRVSIRPPTAGPIRPGHGMAGLLKMWVRVRWPQVTAPPPGAGFHSEFDRVGVSWAARGGGASSG